MRSLPLAAGTHSYLQLEEVLAQIGESKNSHFEMSVKYGKAKLDQYFGIAAHKSLERIRVVVENNLATARAYGKKLDGAEKKVDTMAAGIERLEDGFDDVA